MADTIDKMTGLVYTDEGKVLGRRNFIVQADVSMNITREMVVKAIDEKEAEQKVRDSLERKYKNDNPYVEIVACWSPD